LLLDADTLLKSVIRNQKYCRYMWPSFVEHRKYSRSD